MHRLIARLAALRAGDGMNDDGMNTAEYAVGTLAAVAFAGVLLKVLTSLNIQQSLAGVINEALK